MNPGPTKPVVVFDGDCGFCRNAIARIQRRDLPPRFEYVPRQAPGLNDRFPRLAEQDFNTGLRLILPDGVIRVGADAFYEIARRLPRWRAVAWLYRVPGFGALARVIYRWIAANRMRLGRNCKSDTYATPSDRN